MNHFDMKHNTAAPITRRSTLDGIWNEARRVVLSAHRKRSKF